MATKRQSRVYGQAPERLRDVLRNELGRSLEMMREDDRVAAARPVACGHRMAARTRLLGFEDGVLRVEVADAAWQKQMRSVSEKLKEELRGIAGVLLTDILFLLPAATEAKKRDEKDERRGGFEQAASERKRNQREPGRRAPRG